MRKRMPRNELIIAGLIAAAILLTGIGMAKPWWKHRITWRTRAWNEYGYNERAQLFLGCAKNYVRWKCTELGLGNYPPVECSKNDTWVLINWKFNRNNTLLWIFNMFWCPEGRIIKRFVPLSKEECEARGGAYAGEGYIVQTDQIVPLCEVTRIVIEHPENCPAVPVPCAPITWTTVGQFESLENMVAFPPGMGFYKKILAELHHHHH